MLASGQGSSCTRSTVWKGPGPFARQGLDPDRAKLHVRDADYTSMWTGWINPSPSGRIYER